MDLYLLSPPFLKKLMRRPSSIEIEEEVEDTQDIADVLLVEEEGWEKEDVADLSRRRRSSLDRMLRQHAYIIICAFCYACNTLPSHFI